MNRDEILPDNPERALEVRPSHAVAPPNPAAMMEQMIAKGITQENVAAFAEVVKLSEHIEDRNAKRAFARAYMKLQEEVPRIVATKSVPDKAGNTKFMFAPFEEIDAQARPICLRNGFTYSFSEGPFQQGKITKICTLTHEEGHERSNAYSVRIGQGPPGSTESQADGAAHSYAKRGALCDALNIVVKGLDQDARQLGGCVTPEQAEELERRLKMVNGDVARFLKLAQAPSFAKIPAVHYAMLDENLRRKENPRK